MTYAGSEKMNLPNENLGNCGSTYQMGTWVTVDEPGLSSQSLKDKGVRFYTRPMPIKNIEKFYKASNVRVEKKLRIIVQRSKQDILY